MRRKGGSRTVIERESENDEKGGGVEEERQDVEEDRHKIPGGKGEREGPLMTDQPLN